MSVITIRSARHAYDVTDELSLTEVVARMTSGRRVLTLVDAQLRRCLEATALPADDVFEIAASEEAKSLGNLTGIFEWLLERGLRRDGAVLAIGGGVVQDIACFISSVLLRGVEWRLVPTTLLAQCDSCIGSKSSINIGRFKNQLGTFYPPHTVYLITDFLKTLSSREIRSGLGEAIKLHLLAGPEPFAWLREQMIGEPALAPIIWSSLKIKQPFIEEDEFDQGRRNLLNYGHTFGHAYESATRYAIPHGIAVMLGMMTATFISQRRGWVTTAHLGEVLGFLGPLVDPFQGELKQASTEAIVAAMRLDKKNVGGEIRCILTRGPGAMERATISSEESLTSQLRDFIQELP